MSSEAQVALITGAFTLAGLVGGGLLGWILNGRTRVRNEKRAAFVEFLAAIDACQHGAVRMRAASVVELVTEQETTRMLDSLDRVDAARTMVAMILPRQARQLLADAVTTCATAYDRAMKLEPDDGALNNVWDRVLSLAKKELGYK